MNSLIVELPHFYALPLQGWSRSGKTAFITSFINQLLHINSIDNKHLPLFLSAQNNRLLGV